MANLDVPPPSQFLVGWDGGQREDGACLSNGTLRVGTSVSQDIGHGLMMHDARVMPELVQL